MATAIALVSFATGAEVSSPTPSITGRSTQPPGVGLLFTTEAYEREVVRLLLLEANEVAAALNVGEQLPITKDKLTKIGVIPYGMSEFADRMLGCVGTRNYTYYASVDHKLSYVELTQQDQHRVHWVASAKAQFDTNQAVRLAESWLSRFKADIDSLHRDCAVSVDLDTFANPSKGTASLIVPFYHVAWMYRTNLPSGSRRAAATVQLFAPTKSLVSLRVEDSRYILRQSIQVTNLNVLLNGATNGGVGFENTVRPKNQVGPGLDVEGVTH